MFARHRKPQPRRGTPLPEWSPAFEPGKRSGAGAGAALLRSAIELCGTQTATPEPGRPTSVKQGTHGQGLATLNNCPLPGMGADRRIEVGMILSRVSAPAVADDLLAYLRSRFGLRHATFAEHPQKIPNGWETYIYRFRLRESERLPAVLRAPLVLRLYAGPQGLPRLTHEFAAQRYVYRLNYPSAQPLLMEDDSRYLGGPFMLMEHVKGRTLVDLLFARPWQIYGGPARMGHLHASLHRLPVGGFPGPAGPLLQRSFLDMEGLVEEHGLSGLRPGVEWLMRQRPPDPDRSVQLHLDFHPLNLIFDGRRCTAVLDWCEADVGDRHADVATTMVLFKSVELTWDGAWQRIASWPGRFFLLQGYLEAYHRRLPLERARLRYYFAWASLRRLCRYAYWLRASPQSTGCRPSLAQHVNNDGIDRLAYCFQRCTGVRVTLN